MSSRFAFGYLCRVGLASIAMLSSICALAQTPADAAAPVYLSAAEVNAELVDKPWSGTRGVYGALTQISYRSDHTVEILNVDTSTTRKGTWDIDANGQMCITWSPKAATNCYRYARSGAKLVAYDASDPLKPHAELQRRRPAN